MCTLDCLVVGSLSLVGSIFGIYLWLLEVQKVKHIVQFFGCDHGAMQNSIYAYCINKIGIRVDLKY